MVPITYSFLVMFFVGLYTTLERFYDSPKKRSWILTALASVILSTGSVPFVITLAMNGGRPVALKGANTLIRTFQAYLTADLIMGARHYPTYLSPLLGWCHHIIYIGIAQFCINSSWSHILASALLMEFPTSLLAWGSLHPDKLRHTTFFAVAFFATRILFHLVLIGLYVPNWGRGRIALGGSLVPGALYVLAFPMHVIWFVGCVKGFVRRATKRKEDAIAAATAVPVDVAVTSEDPVDIPLPTSPSMTEPTSAIEDSSTTEEQPSRPLHALRRRISSSISIPSSIPSIPHLPISTARREAVREQIRLVVEQIRASRPRRERFYNAIGLNQERRETIGRAVAVY